MEQNKPAFLEAKKSFEGHIKSLIEKISSFDQSVTGVNPKDCIFRIHRDVRFSNNKLPYKTNMGAFIGSKGKKTDNDNLEIKAREKFILSITENEK